MEPFGPRSDRPVLWTMIGSHDSDGSFVSAFFFSYTASFHLFFFNPFSKITLSLTLKPSLNHSQSSLVSASLKNHSQSSLSQVSITLSSLPLPRHRRTVAAQPRFLPQSSLSQSLSPSSPSHCCSSAQISSSLSQSLNHSLVFTSLPRCRRSSTQIAAHSLMLISASLPCPCRSSLCASSPLPSLVL